MNKAIIDNYDYMELTWNNKEYFFNVSNIKYTVENSGIGYNEYGGYGSFDHGESYPDITGCDLTMQGDNVTKKVYFDKMQVGKQELIKTALQSIIINRGV